METSVNEMSINGVKYIREDAKQSYVAKGDIKIMVLQRGHVLVGRLVRGSATEPKSQCYLYNASVIRTWGTSKGLGEIALEGPKSGTKLDKCNGVVEFDYLTVIFSITCSEEAWKNSL